MKRRYLRTPIDRRTISRAVLAALLFFIPKLAAEPNCSGSIFAYDPTCGGYCAETACHDVSFNTDGSEYQCCPGVTAVPELPDWINPFTLFLIFLLGAWALPSIRNGPKLRRKAC